jgi:hypothetical protein
LPTLLRRAAVAGLTSAFLLTACGGSGGEGSSAPKGSAPKASSAPAATSQVEGLPPEQVVQKAKTALKSAKSVHYRAKGTDDGKPLVFDMRADEERGAVGSIELAGEQVKLIQTKDAVYVTGNAALLAAASGGKPVATGKWVKTTKQAPGISDFLELTDASKFMDQVIKPDQKLSRGTSKTVAGQQTVAVVIGPDAQGKNAATMYVSAQGTPYPLLVETAPSEKDQGSVTFSDFDKPVDVKAPDTKGRRGRRAP